MENLKILQQIKETNRWIIFSLVTIFIVLCAINYSEIDLQIQNLFFDFKNKTWLIDKNESVKKFIFYQFPKIILGCLIFFCLTASILGFKNKSDFFHKNRHKFFLIFLGLALIPLIVGNVKKFTNIYCPTQLEIYDGKYPYVKIFESYSADFIQLKKGKCFPGGHAVSGFALLILFFAFEKKSLRIFSLSGTIIYGWILGLYQMAKGVHFFGDTIVTMLLCFLVAAIINRLYIRFFYKF